MHNKTSQPERTLRQAGNSVKAQIIGSGVAMGDLARASKVAASSLSNLIAGRYKSTLKQVKVWEAFKKLTGRELSLREFWGDLLRKDVA